MVEKLDINNEIILMKKTMQRSKVCVISKLVKKLRDVKKKLEKEPNTLKLSGRSVKLTEQIDYLKRTANVELATLCLISTKNPQQILTNPLSSTSDLALANLCAYKVVDAKIKSIKDKYNLNDAPVEWRQMIREIGKKKQRKITKAGHVRRKEAAKKVKDIQKKRDEWLVENIEPSSMVGVLQPEKDGNDKVTTISNGTRPIPKKTAIIPETKKTTLKRPLEAKDRVVAQHPSEPLQIAKAPPLKLDSFFVTSGGTGYMATGITERHQPIGPNDGLDRRERRAQKFGKSTGRRPQVQPQRNTNMRPQQQQRPPPEAAAAAHIHPSWAAKQKTKGIDQFQGKKIKFGETLLPSTPAIVRNAATTVQSAVADDSSKLHPSWLAKQKLKPIISEFKGKKTTFGD